MAGWIKAWDFPWLVLFTSVYYRYISIFISFERHDWNHNVPPNSIRDEITTMTKSEIFLSERRNKKKKKGAVGKINCIIKSIKTWECYIKLQEASSVINPSHNLMPWKTNNNIIEDDYRQIQSTLTYPWLVATLQLESDSNDLLPANVGSEKRRKNSKKRKRKTQQKSA